VAPTSTLPSTALGKLAPFSYDWVGGNIHGLATFASTLYGYVPEMEDVITALNKKVGQIVGDAGWEGSAASAFTANWEKVSAETNAIGLVVIQTGSIVDQLAVDLSKIENALEKAADETAAHGVQIGSNGQPPQACYSNQTQEEWAEGYASFYQQCIAAANDARVQAAGALQKVFTAITSGTRGKGGDGDDPDVGAKVGEGTTLGDLLADLLASPTAYAGQVADKVAELTEKAKGAKSAWLAAQRAARGADGRFGKMPDNVKTALHDANSELDSAKADLAKAEDGENAFTKVFGTTLEDLPGASKLADGLDNAKLLSKVLDVPVVDVVAGGVATYLNAQADIQKGVPAWAAYPLETGATVASIAAGTAVAGVVTGAITVGAPVLGVAAGVAAGAVVAYGVGDYIHNYIADFGQQIHEHGWVGAFTDFGAAGVSTWDDTKQLGEDVGHVASDAGKSIWHDITSIF
jgi:uncharacterized protein YukE